MLPYPPLLCNQHCERMLFSLSLTWSSFRFCFIYHLLEELRIIRNLKRGLSLQVAAIESFRI